MYLEKIEIQGFKSFAQPTMLLFNKELTAIVGPNGSGKSNIADAIRWVLGEQSLKLLRGKKSEDVIFAGSDTKGRLGFARVTIYLDNKDRTSDMDYDQVVIERHMNRDGESEYMVNSTKVRLVDVQILLAKAHVGQKSYSVIGQGMIDSLLNLSATERRDFFDEATGVRQYQLKKNQALHKLEQTEENLTQAELVLQEIEPRLRTLTRQVRRLERKEDLEKQLREQQNDYYSYLSGTLENQMRALTEKRDREQHMLDTLTQQQKEIQKKLDIHDGETSRQDKYNTLQSKLFNLQQEFNALTKKKIILEGEQDIDLIKTGNKEQVLLKQRISELGNRRQSMLTKSAELEGKNREKKKLIAQLETMVSETSNNLKKIEKEISDRPAATDWDAVASTAQRLHAEHDELLGSLEGLETAESIAGFKKGFKEFSHKLKSFFESLRRSKADDTTKRMLQFTVLNEDLKKITADLHAEKLIVGIQEHELESLKKQTAELEKEEQHLSREVGSADASMRRKTLSQDIDDANRNLAEKESAIKELRSQIDSFNQSEESKKNELVNLQKQFRTLQYDFTVKNNEMTTLKVEVAKLETRKDELDKEIAAEATKFAFRPVERLNAPQTKESIVTIQKQLNIIGGIDTETVKEYTEVHDKHTFLKQQTTDLRGAEKSLSQLITELDEHISKQFQHSFKNINAMFTKYFKKLFNGGNAKLVLQILKDEKSDQAEENEDTDASEEPGEKEKKKKDAVLQSKADRFDYSIEIHATPPGKKLGSTTMLSGGEKALTSISLICAIIANNPPPFVVLDEVDAALDEANSIRFAEIISELIDKSQFITITHNRATMHQAKILYGVTMGDDGMSQLLSVDFDQADKLSA